METIVQNIKKYSMEEFKKYSINEKLEILHPLKLYLDDIYYNTGESLIKDEFYDILKKILISRDPGYIPPVGAKIRDKENRVKIPFWMGSADTITAQEDNILSRWKEKNPSRNILISEKLDGVSGNLIYKNGRMKLYTRGDGIEGADISFIIQYIKNIPKNISEDISIRGELILEKNIFEKKYKKKSDSTETTGTKNNRIYKNSRNMVSGIVGAKTVKEGLKDLLFIVYEIIGNETMPKISTQFEKLENMGFRTAMNKKFDKDIDIDFLTDIHNNFKKKSVFEIDGIVIHSDVPYDRNISGNPEYLFAYKVSSENMNKITEVVDIKWSISSWGHIIPVAIINPVDFSGVTVSRVTLSNASLMKEKFIGPGAIVKVTRSKEVIPFIVSVEKQCDKLKWPDIEYNWDCNNVHIKVSKITEKVKLEMETKLIARFFEKMNIKNINIQTVIKFYKAGYNTIIKIISASENDFIKIDGIQKKLASKICQNIKEGLQNVKTSQLLSSAGVFGYGINNKKIESLMTDIPDILSASKDSLKERILDIEGFSEITANKIVENIDNAVNFIDEISSYVSFEDTNRVSNTLVGMKFCFSGFRNKILEQKIEERGGKTVSSVSKKTTALIVQNKNDKNTTKVTKAITCNVPIYLKEEFTQLYSL